MNVEVYSDVAGRGDAVVRKQDAYATRVVRKQDAYATGELLMVRRALDWAAIAWSLVAKGTALAPRCVVEGFDWK